MVFFDKCMNTLLILLLTVSCNFTGSLLSCNLQKQFTDNVYIKHFILFCILFVTLTLTNPGDFVSEEDITYLQQVGIILGHTLIIYLLFLLLSRMTIKFSLVCITLILIHFSVSKYASAQAEPKTYDIYLNIIQGSTLVCIIIGFYMYYQYQVKMYGKEFKWTTFIFGKPVCNSLK